MSQLINIAQIRARNALSAAADQAGSNKSAESPESEGDALSGYPSLVINNGLIATIAYSLDKGKQPQRIADAIAYHFANMPGVNFLGGREPNALSLRDALCHGDADLLKRATDEALEFLAYLKRFQRG